MLDEATGQWGIRVNRVEVKAIDPPATIQEAMEKQMRAERDRRAAILTAEGGKQSEILNAEGERQAAVLRAEGNKAAAILNAEGEAQAIDTVFRAIHEGGPDQGLLPTSTCRCSPARAGRGEQDLRHPERVHPGARRPGSALGNAREDREAARRPTGRSLPRSRRRQPGQLGEGNGGR